MKRLSSCKEAFLCSFDEEPRPRKQFGWLVRFTLCTPILVLFITGCGTSRVNIPNVNQDKKPTISVSAFPPGNNGDIEVEQVTSSNSVNVALGTDLIFSASARNPGGVRDLSLSIEQGGKILYSVKVADTPDSNNQVTTVLNIPGTNGAGGVGSKSLILRVTTPVQVTAEATTFNGVREIVLVTYQPKPISADFTVEPSFEPGLDDTYIMKWQTFYVTNGTTISILPWSQPKAPVLSGKGFVNVIKTTTFVLTASTPFSTATRNVTIVKNGQPPQQQEQTVTYTFYLARQLIWEGPVPYTSVFGQGINGFMVQFMNPNPFPIAIVKAGHSSTECFSDPNTTVILKTNAVTTPQDVQSIYGVQKPVFPIPIIACIYAGGKVPDRVPLTITYTYK